MDDLDRPNLSLDVIEQIEVELHRQDMRFWPLLKALQLPTPETQKSYAPFVFNEGPMPPRRPRKLSQTIADYAAALFQVEASTYPRLDPQFAHWLQRLSERIEERTIQRIEQVEAGNTANSLAYHGLSIEGMRTVINASLRDAVKAWPQSAELTRITSSVGHEPVQPGKTHKVDRARNLRRAFVEPLLLQHGWSLLDWANEAQVAYHTVSDYLAGTTRPYRSSRLKMAKALSVTVQQLPE